MNVADELILVNDKLLHNFCLLLIKYSLLLLCSFYIFTRIIIHFCVCLFYQSIPDDDACKLWGVDKGPTNVMIHTEDGRLFNVFLSAGKGKLFLFHGWSNVVEHLRLTKGCLVVFNPVSSTTFKLTSYVDRVSRGSFWTYLLPPSSNFYVRYILFLLIVLMYYFT